MVARVCALPYDTDSVNSTTARLRTLRFANLCIMVSVLVSLLSVEDSRTVNGVHQTNEQRIFSQ
jgi:hypothetical protein